MRDMNHLTICMSELIVAMQEYLDKRWPTDTPTIDNIKLESGIGPGTGRAITMALKSPVNTQLNSQHEVQG